MLVHEVMNAHVVYANQTESAARAARLLSRHNIGAVPVLGDKGKLRGIVTDRDIVLRCIALDNDPGTTPLRDVMSRCVVTASPEEDLESAVKKMTDAQVRRLPVVEGGRLVGMLSISDLAKTAGCTELSAEALSGVTSNMRRL